MFLERRPLAANQDTSFSAILKLSGGEGEETFIDIFNVREKFICVLILGAVHKLHRGGVVIENFD